MAVLIRLGPLAVALVSMAALGCYRAAPRRTLREIAVTADDDLRCARFGASELWCWGRPQEALGLEPVEWDVPVLVASGTGPAAAESGASCALDGRALRCRSHTAALEATYDLSLDADTLLMEGQQACVTDGRRVECVRLGMAWAPAPDPVVDLGSPIVAVGFAWVVGACAATEDRVECWPTGAPAGMVVERARWLDSAGVVAVSDRFTLGADGRVLLRRATSTPGDAPVVIAADAVSMSGDIFAGVCWIRPDGTVGCADVDTDAGVVGSAWAVAGIEHVVHIAVGSRMVVATDGRRVWEWEHAPGAVPALVVGLPDP